MLTVKLSPMLDSFDPSGLASPRECVEELRGLGLELGFRAGARLFSLSQRGVRFSLAFLEAAAEGGPEQRLLMDPGWNALEQPQQSQVEALVGDCQAVVVAAGGLLHVVTPDEAPSPTALVHTSSESLLSSVAGGADPQAFSGILWDRRKMEQASLCLLDGEDADELVESFRYLFRALVTSGQSPMDLMVTALKRGKQELSLEVARQVQEHLNRELGRALRAVVSAEPKPMQSALNYLLGEDGQAWAEVLAVVLLPALRGVVSQPEGRAVVFSVLEQTVERIGTDPREVESFLDALVDEMPRLSLTQRLGFARFLEKLQSVYPPVTTYLLTQLKVARSPQDAAFFGHVLSRMQLSAEEKGECLERMVELFSGQGLETALEERLKNTFVSLGAAALERLSDPFLLRRLGPARRMDVIALWNRFRAEGLEMPDQKVFVELALTAVHDRRRDTVLALVRSGQMTHPALVKGLRADPNPEELVSYFTGEAFRLEEPDDEEVFRLLAEFGGLPLEKPFARLRQEAALGSAAAAHRLLFFARLANHLKLDKKGRKRLVTMVAELLEFKIYHPGSHPNVWLGLGYLGALPGLPPDLVRRSLELVSADLEQHPEQKVEALLRIYPHASQEQRVHTEEALRSIFASESSLRPVLKACLSGLEQLLQRGEFLVEPEKLVADLCRTVLFKGREQNLQQVMRQALSYATEGDGVRRPTVWDREDREQALRILGAIVVHPATDERLHRMVLVRLFSFLQDWLDEVERGKDLYACRDTALFDLLDPALRRRPGEVGFDYAGEVGWKLIELHRRVPHQLNLEWRESAQRFLLTLVELDVGAELRKNGVRVDLPDAILNALMELEPVEEQEVPVSRYLLSTLHSRATLRNPLEERLCEYLGR